MASPSDIDAKQRQMLQLALQPSVPRIYANGFMITQTATDMTLVLLHNGSPAATLSLSYISAKSLLVDLGQSIKSIEDVIGTIQTAHEIVPKMAQVKGHLNVEF